MTARDSNRRVLVAGVGNVLRGDDGFGPAVVQALERRGALPPGVQLYEAGIGGIGLVQELIGGYDVLVLVDAVDRGGAPGTLYILEPEVPDAAGLPGPGRPGLTVDAHQTVPESVLILARAAGVLPPLIRIVGCQPGETEVFATEVGPAVRPTVDQAVRWIDGFLADLATRPAAPPATPRAD